ncbi:uroporphyrinogen decarboxylase [Candidatus Pelagibacter sp.]|nr:uroporphyrinogen decarboxylase [Candidatus Pelagibacter sp.]
MNTLIQDCINNKSSKTPIWLMRQAGRYLPEFRSIREKNQDFIKLCLNTKLSSEITIQPINRFDFDAAIIFSDILLVPYALGQQVKFKKNFGPDLKKVDLNILNNVKKGDFLKKLNPVYETIKETKKKLSISNKDTIGFVGAPWTLLLYMLNRKSPKEGNFNIFPKDKYINNILIKLDEFLKIHIEAQIKNGASIIQIFDSWAGLLPEKDLDYFVYKPIKSLVDFVRQKKTISICFPRNISSYKKFVDNVNPDIISIDYNVDPLIIRDTIDIPVQGGLDPKILLQNKEIVRNEVTKYLKTFDKKRYIFNLGHGVLPETNPDIVRYLVDEVRSFNGQ